MNGDDEIEDLLKLTSLQKVEIPEMVDRRIDETLKKCKKRKPNFFLYFGRVIVTIATGLTVATGCIGAYALMGGEIKEKPVLEYLGIRAPQDIEEYKQKIEGQEVFYQDTKVDLVSAICSEGVTILEFDVKLSKEDKEKLLLGESTIRQEDYDNFEKYKEVLRQEAEENAEPGKEEEYFRFKIESAEESLRIKEGLKYTLGLALNTEQVVGKYSPDEWNQDMDMYGSIYIDDQGYYVKNWQKCEEISEYEYRIYQMYLLTDNELQGKEEFKITLKNNKLVNLQEIYNEEGEEWQWRNDAQWFHRSFDDEYYEEQRTNIFELDGDFEIEVSKKKVLENSQVIEDIDAKSEFRNITISAEKVTVSPIQTIIQVRHTVTNQTTAKSRNRNDGIEWMPMTNYFTVYDENGVELDNIALSNWHTLIYEDGTTRTYDSHDIPQDKITNATYETVIYIILENTECARLTIVPTEEIYDLVDGEEVGHIDMEPIEINLK